MTEDEKEDELKAIFADRPDEVAEFLWFKNARQLDWFALFDEAASVATRRAQRDAGPGSPYDSPEIAVKGPSIISGLWAIQPKGII